MDFYFENLTRIWPGFDTVCLAVPMNFPSKILTVIALVCFFRLIMPCNMNLDMHMYICMLVQEID